MVNWRGGGGETCGEPVLEGVEGLEGAKREKISGKSGKIGKKNLTGNGLKSIRKSKKSH